MKQGISHLTPTQRTQIDAFRRAGMKVVDIAKEVGVHYTTIYRELKRCTYEHLNSDYTTEIRYNPDGAQARYEANLRAKGPELKIGNDYELADYLIGKIRDEKYSPEAAIGRLPPRSPPGTPPEIPQTPSCCPLSPAPVRPVWPAGALFLRFPPFGGLRRPPGEARWTGGRSHCGML